MPSVPLTSIAGSGVRAWVSGANYAVGDQSVSLSNFQIYTRMVAGAGTTDPASDSTNWRQASQTIKSIQRGAISLTSSSPVAATITSVDTAKSVLINMGWSGTSGINVMLALTNSTTITATAQGATSSQVNYQIIEYY